GAFPPSRPYRMIQIEPYGCAWSLLRYSLRVIGVTEQVLLGVAGFRWPRRTQAVSGLGSFPVQLPGCGMRDAEVSCSSIPECPPPEFARAVGTAPPSCSRFTPAASTVAQPSAA